jgi:hypothetical protein
LPYSGKRQEWSAIIVTHHMGLDIIEVIMEKNKGMSKTHSCVARLAEGCKAGRASEALWQRCRATHQKRRRSQS